MPWCHRHPDVQVITDFRGVSTCVRCEDEARAEFARHCAVCVAPIPAPGLCPECQKTQAHERGMTWLGQHPLTILCALALVAAVAIWSSFRTFVCSAVVATNRGDPCVVAAARGEDISQLSCPRVVRSCAAVVYSDSAK